MRYDIRCRDCEHIEERSLAVKDTDNLEPCSECGSEEVHIYIGSAPGTIYKGGGWFCKSGSYNKHPKITKKDIHNYETKDDTSLKDYDSAN